MTHRFQGAEAVVSALRPVDPLLLLKPEQGIAAARRAVCAFPGTIAYAVKVGDQPALLAGLHAAGIDNWDVASIHEVRAVREQMPAAVLHYMNPVKSAPHIAEAYGLGVRSYAFDCERELMKIIEQTEGDREVVPVLRVAVPNDKAMFPLDGKFGASEEESARLLGLANTLGYRTGITFHVGSQCENADAYGVATEIACRAAVTAGVMPHIVDIGGGYPAPYRGDEPSFDECVGAAKQALDRWLPRFGGIFQCEPGRVLAAPFASVLVRVELRKDNALHLNDGYYGLLSELKWMPGLHPVRLVRADEPSRAGLAPFSFYGPTCDSHDAMEGPYMLPADIREGDWLEVDLMGAYSTVLAGRFNGFPEAAVVEVAEARSLAAAA